MPIEFHDTLDPPTTDATTGPPGEPARAPRGIDPHALHHALGQARARLLAAAFGVTTDLDKPLPIVDVLDMPDSPRTLHPSLAIRDLRLILWALDIAGASATWPAHSGDPKRLLDPRPPTKPTPAETIADALDYL
jgi:hypothetical protein